MTEQRRGLPRTRGGEAWPPAGTPVPEFAALPAAGAPLATDVAAPVGAEPAAAVPTDVAAPTPQAAPVVAATGASPVAATARRRTGLGGTPAERFAPVVTEASPAAPAPASSGAAPASAPAAATAAAPAAFTPAASAALTATRRVGLGHTPAESPAALAAIAEAAAAVRTTAPTTGAPAMPIQASEAQAPAAPAAAAAEAPAAPARRQGLGTAAAAETAASASAAATLASTANPAAAAAAAAPQTSVNQPSDVAAEPAAERPAAREPKPFRRSPGKIALTVAGVLIVVAAVVAVDRWFLFHTSAGASFLKSYPGTTTLPSWAPVGQPLWTQWQHWLNAFFIVLIIKTGWTVRTQKKASAMWQPRNGGKKISVELFTHLSLDVVWLVNGIVFWVLLFVSGQWIRIVPYSWDFIPNAISAGLQYASLWSWPTEDGWTNYNSLQVLTYFATVFLAAPLAAATGFRMSPMWRNTWARASKVYPVELARKIHFPVMVYFVLFVIVHVVLVLSTGALRNLNHMFWGSDSATSWAGFSVFVLGIAAIIAAWFVLKPMVMQQIGSVFGKVGR